MEERLRKLEITQALQDERIIHLTTAVEANTVAVNNLAHLVSTSKGAWLVVTGLAGIVAFFVTIVVAIFTGKSNG
jgi:hypothetical protein